MTLDDILDSPLDTSIKPTDKWEEQKKTVVVPFEGIDPRLKLLSHSSRLTLHSCPRKYQLYRLNSKQDDPHGEFGIDVLQEVTFAFGHTVGIGVQAVLAGCSEVEIFMYMFLEWDTDLFAEHAKKKKSFWEAMFAIKRLLVMRQNGYLDDYEVVQYKGRPAIELSFKINLPKGFAYRGYVDAVLKHKTTGEILVLELKTTGNRSNPAQYKNSGQALGYSVILDIMYPGISSYDVLYLVYETPSREFVEYRFNKSLLQKALWLQEILIDTINIQTYEEFETYPMQGESCFAYYRECEYLSICTLSTERLAKAYTLADKERIEGESYMFEIDFDSLIDSQIAKGEE